MESFTAGLLSVIFFGLQGFLFKVSSERRHSVKTVTISFMVTVSFISSLFFIFSKEQVTNVQDLLIFAFINSLAFFLLTIFRFESLFYVPSSIAVPLFQLSLILVVLFSFIYFRENLNTTQWVGICTGIISAILLAKQGKTQFNSIKIRRPETGLIFVFIAIVFGAISQIITKLAAVSEYNTFAFIGASYFYGTLLTLIFYNIPIIRKNIGVNNKGNNMREMLFLGVSIGIANFLAFYLYLFALRTMELSRMSILQSFSPVIIILLSVFFYREKINIERFLGILLSFIAVILLRL